MSDKLTSNAQKIQNILNELGFSIEVKELPDSTRTSSDAAKALGCDISQIAKTIVFKGVETEKPYLVIASGSNRIKEKKIEKFVKEKIKKAGADFVKNKTGFSIGGVPPLGHIEKIPTFIDKDLFKYPEIWAAAGTPNAVFKLTPEQLIKITGGKAVNIF